jgi:hypothetical protein
LDPVVLDPIGDVAWDDPDAGLDERAPEPLRGG